jgi:pre-mRNA-splicing factor ISY1
MKDIDADYYGYRDDDDGILIPLEAEAEQECV